jgi:6-phosphofructokinase 1
MGRHSGYLALMSAMASGAEVAVIPEVEITLPEMAAKMKAAFDRGKSHFIALVAEGAPFKSQQIYEYLCEVGHFETRLTILGHLQRGGSPSAYDRILATHLGNEAVECLLEGVSGVMIGEKGGTFVRTPLELVVKRTSAVNKKVYELIQRLS